MPATLDLRRGQVVGDASRRAINLNTLSKAVANATYAPIASPSFTGDPKAPTPAPGDNDTSVATTAFVGAAIGAAPNKTITLSGDIAGSGTAAITTTLPNVNANVGTFQGLTVNAKGLVTAATSQVGQVPGTATNNNASAGNVGEVISAVATAGVATTSGVALTVATLSLTAGDWDVSGEVWINPATGITVLATAINTVGAAFPSLPALNTAFSMVQLGASATEIAVPLSPCRVSLAGTTSYFLTAQQNGATGALAYGKIIARRAR